MSKAKSYIRVDKHGVMRVGVSRVMLDSVVAGFQQGHSPETIRQQYPSLSLEEVYGAIAYYLAHLKKVNAYLCRQDGLWEQWQAKSERTPSSVRQRLRAMRRAGMPERS